MTNEMQAQLVALLDRKQTFYERYEQETDALLLCEIDEMNRHVSRRDELIVQIDALEHALEELCAQIPEGDAARDALRCRCDREGLDVGLSELFEHAQRIFTVMNRVAMIEPQVVDRMRQMQDELMTLIRQRNNAPKIGRYLDTLSEIPENGSFLSSRFQKV